MLQNLKVVNDSINVLLVEMYWPFVPSRFCNNCLIYDHLKMITLSTICVQFIIYEGGSYESLDLTPFEQNIFKSTYNIL